MTSSYPLTEVRPQGIQHILTLAGATSFGLGLFVFTGSFLVAVPVALGAFYQLWKTTPTMREPEYCNALGEVWTYRLSPEHPSVDESYDEWCQKYGVEVINGIIEPMIGNCTYANFANNPDKYAYPGLQGVLVYDCEEPGVPPLVPHHYVEFRLQQREEAIARSRQFVAPLATTRHQEPVNPTPIHQPPILVAAAEVVEPEQPSKVLDTSETVSEVPTPSGEAPKFVIPGDEPKESVFDFLVGLTQAPLQPVILVGQQGSGKGTAATLALNLGKRKNGLRFWVFNPKAALQEAGYWDEADHVFLKNVLDLEDNSIFHCLMEVLNQFAKEGDRRNQIPGAHPPMVLLIEEINATVARFNPKQKEEFKGRISTLASTLRAVNMAVWLSGQSINLDQLGLSSKTDRAMFEILAAVGEKRTAIQPALDLLGIKFDPTTLKGRDRYWITSSGVFLAPPPFPVRQYTAWSEVANLVDMRRKETREQPPEALSLDQWQQAQHPQADPDEELWADYQEWHANGGSDRQWKLTRLGGEGGDKHRKLELLKARFGGTSESVSEVVAA